MVLREIHLAVLEAKEYPKDYTGKLNNDLLPVKTRFKVYSEQAGLQVSVDTQIPNSKVSIETVSRQKKNPNYSPFPKRQQNPYIRTCSKNVVLPLVDERTWKR